MSEIADVAVPVYQATARVLFCCFDACFFFVCCFFSLLFLYAASRLTDMWGGVDPTVSHAYRLQTSSLLA